MPPDPTDDAVLTRFRAALGEMYGDRLERVVLFGSRARGEAHAASDYDVAIFLKSLPDHWQEVWRLADLRVDFIDATGAFFRCQAFRNDGLSRAYPYHERDPPPRPRFVTPEATKFVAHA